MLVMSDFFPLVANVQDASNRVSLIAVAVKQHVYSSMPPALVRSYVGSSDHGP